MNTIKPKLVYQKGKWICHDDFFIMAEGNTLGGAYAHWRSLESRRTRIPRSGRWNKKSCIAWYKRGCPPTRHYIGSKQIFAYDIITDELILRG